jgi:hypothetical protein
MAHDVFISYSNKDKVVADAVCAKLEEKGIRCWIAPRDIIPGLEWSESIINALSECRIAVVVFSSSSDASQQVRREAERAVSKGVIILPFRIEDIYPSGAMEYYLSTSHWLDALTTPLESHLDRLTESVRMLLENPHTLQALPKDNATDVQTTASGAVAASAAAVGAPVSAPVDPRFISVNPDTLPQELRGFNWGAFLLNRNWVLAHNTWMGCWMTQFSAAPYVGLLVALIWGFESRIAWLLGAGVLSWLAFGFKGNEWAWANRVWINHDHFKKVQRSWLLRGVAFWAVVAVCGTVFVKTGYNRQAQAAIEQAVGQVEKFPVVVQAKQQVKQMLQPAEKPAKESTKR